MKTTQLKYSRNVGHVDIVVHCYNMCSYVTTSIRLCMAAVKTCMCYHKRRLEAITYRGLWIICTTSVVVYHGYCCSPQLLTS